MKDKKIYLKDIIKDKSYEELVALLPFMVCVEKDEENCVYKSYHVLGFGNNSIILGRYEPEDDELCKWGTNEEPVLECEILPFNKIDEVYIFAHKATDKQKAFIKKYTNEGTYNLSGYHAFRIISTIIRIWGTKPFDPDYYDHDYSFDDMDMFDTF